jgi:hypothetical protein
MEERSGAMGDFVLYCTAGREVLTGHVCLRKNHGILVVSSLQCGSQRLFQCLIV